MGLLPDSALFRPLTPAQSRVVELVAHGLSYKSIARELGIARATAKKHVEMIAMLLPTDDLPAYRRVQCWIIRGRRAA